MGVIYKITNTINNKIYIGQTNMTEPQRWQAHIWHAYNDPENDSVALCHAIAKYGRESFKREILATANTQDELNQLEQHYIKKYNSTDRNIGYNISCGGDGHLKVSDEEILKAYNKYGSLASAARALNMSRSGLDKRFKALGIISRNLTIYQYDLEGNLIQIYDSFSDAKRKTLLNLPYNVPKSHFSCGYMWVYEAENNNIEQLISEYKSNNRYVKEVQQYDLNGNFICSFKSAAEASRKLGINVSSIKGVINGKQSTGGGFLWYKLNGLRTFDEVYNHYLLSRACCQIEEVDINGNIIKQYCSSSEAETKLNWSYNVIKQVCDGKKTHTHGRYFRYSNPDKRKLIEEQQAMREG